MIGDVTAAFLQAPVNEDELVFVIPLKPELKDAERELWLLSRSLYSLRKARIEIGEFFRRTVQTWGCARSRVEPQLYFNKRFPGALLSAHVGDLMLKFLAKDLVHIQMEMAENMGLKWLEELGETWLRYLGVEWKEKKYNATWKLECKVPRKYFECLLSEWKLERAKVALTQAVKGRKTEENEDVVDDATYARYRRIVGRLMWSAMSILTIAFRNQAPSTNRNSLEIPASILVNMQAATALRNTLYEP